jgi:hypothetical protein
MTTMMAGQRVVSMEARNSFVANRNTTGGEDDKTVHLEVRTVGQGDATRKHASNSASNTVPPCSSRDKR